MSKRVEVLQLPLSVGVRSIQQLCRICAEIRAATGPIELDCRDVRFFDPLGMTLLAASIDSSGAPAVDMNWLSRNIASYLDRMDFFSRRVPIGGVDVQQNGRKDRSDRLFELTKLDSLEQAEEAAERLANAVAGRIVGRPEHPLVDFGNPDLEFNRYSKPVRYALSELLNNSLTHARRNGRVDASVWVASQYYDRDGSNFVHVAVVDDGCGFLETLRNHPELPEQTHAAAIRTALRERISCNRDLGVFAGSVNEGVGLTTTSRIALAAAGQVHIVSGNSLYVDVGTTSKRRDRSHALDCEWQGVIVSVTFARDRLPFTEPAKLLPKVEQVIGLHDPAIELRFND